MIGLRKEKQKSFVTINGEMTIYNAAELKEKLMPILKDDRAVEINLSDVSEIDSAGLQLLMLAKRTCDSHGQILSLVEHNQAVIEALDLMGLVGYFEDPIIVSDAKGERHGS